MSGLMRSLLWQICKARPSIIDRLLSRDSTLLYSPSTETRLMDILEFALSAYRNDPLFFVIDGLDEFEGDQSDLLDELQNLALSPRTKVCISSRPEEAFRRRVEDLPLIRPQDLNCNDIYKYAHTKLRCGDDRTTKLAQDVTSNAEGIFLWAVLVCDSLCSGLTAEDDEDTLLQRLNAYPEGLDDLFDKMFANLEVVHHKSLAFYFHAAQQSSFSVALAAASRSAQPVENLEQFGTLCDREAIRITTQSKGLLQISPVPARDEGQYIYAWSLQDIQTHSQTPLPLCVNAFRRVEQRLDSRVEFVHRSAYDYIQEDTNAGRRAWLDSTNEDEIFEKTLHGALWLARHGPILHMVEGKLRMTYRFGGVFCDATSACATYAPETEQERLYGALEKLADLLNSWMSAIYNNDQAIAQATQLKSNEWHSLESSLPLQEFWSDCVFMCPEFVTSHSSQLLNSDAAYSIITALIIRWSGMRSQGSITPGLELAMSSITAEFSRQKSLCRILPSCKMEMAERHVYIKLGQSRDEWYMSWGSISARDEASNIRRLEGATRFTSFYKGPLRLDMDDPDTPSSDHQSNGDPSMDLVILQTLCEMTECWRIFSGTCVKQHGPHSLNPTKPLLLQVSLPVLYRWPPHSRHFNQAELHDLLSICCERKLRFSCYARQGLKLLDSFTSTNQLKTRRREKQHFPTGPIATYDLSVEATDLLMKHSALDQLDLVVGTSFVGTASAQSDCLQTMMNEIWDDTEGQLTA
jgi:hypothetical protein